MKLILASNNQGKIDEIRRLLPGLDVQRMRDAGYTEEIPEPFATFRENAQAKARAVHARFGNWVLSDDSGICVNALGGAPGVYSARYAGAGADDGRNNQQLLAALEGTADRSAFYYAVLCLITPDGSAYFFEGTCHGRIGVEPRGNRGFGYDPLFIPDGYSESFGQLPDEIKGSISHRARALNALLESGIFQVSETT